MKKLSEAVQIFYVELRLLIPDKMLEDLDKLAKYLDESYEYVMSLDPK